MASFQRHFDTGAGDSSGDPANVVVRGPSVRQPGRDTIMGMLGQLDGNGNAGAHSASGLPGPGKFAFYIGNPVRLFEDTRVEPFPGKPYKAADPWNFDDVPAGAFQLDPERWVNASTINMSKQVGEDYAELVPVNGGFGSTSIGIPFGIFRESRTFIRTDQHPTGIGTSNFTTELTWQLQGNGSGAAAGGAQLALRVRRNFDTGNLEARVTRLNVSATLATIAWDGPNMVYWQLRETGGTTFWEYSPDGVTYTTLFSQATYPEQELDTGVNLVSMFMNGTPGLSWNIGTINVQDRVSSPRAVVYNIKNAVQSTRAVVYNIKNSVQSARAVVYNILNRVQSDRAIVYDIINDVVTSIPFRLTRGKVSNTDKEQLP